MSDFLFILLVETFGLRFKHLLDQMRPVDAHTEFFGKILKVGINQLIEFNFGFTNFFIIDGISDDDMDIELLLILHTRLLDCLSDHCASL